MYKSLTYAMSKLKISDMTMKIIIFDLLIFDLSNFIHIHTEYEVINKQDYDLGRVIQCFKIKISKRKLTYLNCGLDHFQILSKERHGHLLK